MTDHRSSPRLALAIAIVLIAAGDFFIVTAVAQESAEIRLEEITVTARKREESLQDVPIAITAISEQEISDAGFQNILDIAKATPGMVFESYNSLPGRYESVPFIRGVVFDNNDPTRQTVSVFVDGIYVAGGTQGIGVEDVQRIEVIKGPQSAQFGRATYAGAVNYVTRDPSDEFQGQISGLVATRDEQEFSAWVEGPVASNVLTGRLSARYLNHGGHYPNDRDSNQKLGEEETVSVGGTLLFRPNDAFSMKLRGFFSVLDDNHPAVALHDSTLNSGPFGGIETIFVGVLPERTNTGLNVTQDDFQTFIERARDQGVTFIGGEPDQFGMEREASRLSLDGSYDFGAFTVSAMIGVNKDESTVLQDADFSPDDAFTIYAGRDFEDTTAELRFAGTALSDQLEWALGYSYYDLDYNTNGAFGVPAFAQASSFGNLGEITLNEINTTAVFGQLSYAFADFFRVNLEARSQDDEIDQKLAGDPSTSVAGAPGKFSSFLPRITLDFHPIENALLYASYSEGNLPGGFNGAFLALSPGQQAEARQQFPGLGGTFDEEILEQVEIGWKQTFSRGSLGLAVYRMERTDQVTTAVATVTNPDFGQPNEPEFNSVTVRTNTAGSEILGAELEGVWYPSDGLSMRATVAYTDAEISRFPDSGDSGDYEDVFGTDEGFIGQKAERYPEWQMTFSSTYETPIALFSNDTNFFVRGDLFYADKYYLSTPNLGEAPPVTDANLRAGFRNDRYSLEAFVTNLFEETAPVTANNASDLSNATPLFSFSVEATNIGLRDKRQFGLRASWRF